MRKLLSILSLASLIALNLSAQSRGNLILSDDETHGYLNCHMSDRGQWTAYALSEDGQHYHDLLHGDSIFSAVEMAGIEGGTRDAYICRRHDNQGFLMVTTDMNNSMTKRLNKPSEWSNFGINLLTSPDLINWTSTTIDFRQWQPSVTRVWAPQVIWDGDYQWSDGRQGGYMIYYSMLDLERESYDRMYYSYADANFKTLTPPQLLFDWGYATIDADINWIEADQQYHMMIKKEGGTPGIFTTSSAQLTGPWPEPDDSHFVNFEGKKKCEGASAFQLKGGQWQIGYIEYSSRPRHYRLCDADATLSTFSNPRDIEGVTGPQHGSFLRIAKEEYDRLQAWSDAQEATESSSAVTDTKEEEVVVRRGKRYMTFEAQTKDGSKERVVAQVIYEDTLNNVRVFQRLLASGNKEYYVKTQEGVAQYVDDTKGQSNPLRQYLLTKNATQGGNPQIADYITNVKASDVKECCGIISQQNPNRIPRWRFGVSAGATFNNFDIEFEVIASGANYTRNLESMSLTRPWVALYADYRMSNGLSAHGELSVQSYSLQQVTNDQVHDTISIDRTLLCLPLSARYTIVNLRGKWLPYIEAGIQVNIALTNKNRHMVGERNGSGVVTGYSEKKGEHNGLIYPQFVCGAGVEYVLTPKHSLYLGARYLLPDTHDTGNKINLKQSCWMLSLALDLF